MDKVFNEGMIRCIEEAFNCKVKVLKTEKIMKPDIKRLYDWVDKRIDGADPKEGEFDAYVHVLEQIINDPLNYDDVIKSEE